MNQVNTSFVTAVGQALVQVGEAIVLGFERLAVAVNVENVAAIDQFEIRARIRDRTITLASSSGHYTSPTGALLAASGNLAALAANATGWVLIDTRAFSYFSFWAACAADGPTSITLDLRSG